MPNLFTFFLMQGMKSFANHLQTYLQNLKTMLVRSGIHHVCDSVGAFIPPLSKSYCIARTFSFLIQVANCAPFKWHLLISNTIVLLSGKSFGWLRDLIMVYSRYACLASHTYLSFHKHMRSILHGSRVLHEDLGRDEQKHLCKIINKDVLPEVCRTHAWGCTQG